MRVLAFSDVHGNAPAVRALLNTSDAAEADLLVCCGDFMGYFKAVDESISLLVGDRRLVAVAGNHDIQYLFSTGDGVRLGELSERYGSVYTDGLSAESRRFLAELPLLRTVEADGCPIFVCHGSPSDPLCGRVYPDSDLDGMGICPGDGVTFLGHTHYRMNRSFGSGSVVNPGSLGQPRDGGGFSYCVFDTRSRETVFKEVRPDWDAILALLDSETVARVAGYLKGRLPWERRF